MECPPKYRCDRTLGALFCGRVREWLCNVPAGLILLCLAASWAHGDANLVDLRLGEWADRTRLVLETDRQLFVELQPTAEGLVLNIDGLAAGPVAQALREVIPADHPYIRRAFSESRSGATRIQLELLPSMETKSFHLTPMEGFQHRWVLDLFPRQRAEPRVSSARLGQQPERTRIVLESKEVLDATLVMLSSPRQLILELAATEQSPVLKELSENLQGDHPFIKSLQLNRTDGGDLQLVVDLAEPVQADMFKLRHFGDFPHRLVLDLYPRDAGPLPVEPRPLIVEQPVPSSDAPPITAEPADPPVVTAEPAEDKEPTEGWYEVTVNGRNTGDVTLALLGAKGRLFLDGRDLRRWRMLDPPARALAHVGGDYYPVDAYPGLSYQLDEREQRITLQVPPRHFETTSLAGRDSGLVEPDPTPLGAFLNYDIFATADNGERKTSVLLDAGAFNGWGSTRGRFLARSPSEDGQEKWLRLDTHWTRDNPGSLRSLRVGDSITRAGAWGGAVRFGGVQWGRSFDTQPGFITLPMPQMEGEAALPSTVDLYINDSLRLRRDVPSGPFSIDNLPVITGRGEARLVVRDILGNEQVITEDYYASSELLRQGLHDYSYEVGSIRENYGQTSNDYGRGVAVGTHRYGFSERFTGELRGEFLQDQRSVGIAGTWGLPWGGVVNAAAASSHSERGAGSLLSVGFQRQGDWFNWGVETQAASEHFVSLGMDTRRLPRRQTRASIGFAGRGVGSFGLGYVQRDYYDREDVALFSANYRLGLGRFGQLSVSALQSADSGDTSLNLHFSLPLGAERTSGSYSRSSSSRGVPQESIQVQRSLPAGSGLGFRLRAGRGSSDYQQIGLDARTKRGSYNLEAAQRGEQRSYRAGARGGFAAAGATLLHGRQLGSSFGVVRLPGFPGVRIYAENQLVGETNNRGHALIPHLRPYEKNRLAIEEADLPLSARVDMLEMQVIPSRGSGVLADFPVARSRDALLRLVLDNGEALPMGATVEIPGRAQRFPVGRRGEVYLTDLDDHNSARAFWEGRECRLEFSIEENNEMLLDLGEHRCEEVFH